MLNWLGKSFSTALFGDKDEKPIRIPSGQFYQLDPTIKQSSILKYKDASLNLRRSQTEWQSQLIISRIYDDGEQEDPLDQDDDFIFLIDRHMLMSVQPCHDNTSPLSILFKDLNHSSRLYEFVADSTISNNAINTFVEMCYQRMFERSNHRQCDSQEELLKWTTDLKREGESISTRFQKPQHFLTPAKPITTPILHTQVTSIPQPITPSPLQQIKIEPLLVFETPLGDELISVMCQLYLYDLRVSQFVLMKELVSVKLLHSEKFAFSLSIESEDNSPYMAQPLDSEMNPVFNIEQLAFVWVYYSQETGMPLYTWSLKFNSHIPFDAFKEMFGRCLYETLNQDLFSKLKKDESKYVVDAYTEDCEMMDISNDESEDRNEEEELSEQDSEVEEDAKKHNENKDNVFQNESAKNSHLAVGFKSDRSFVVRGNKIGVFKYTEDDDLDHVTTINNVGTPKGDAFAPRKVMLHEGDRTMLLMKQNDNHNIYKMDLEYGKVVEEWKVDDDMTVNDIVPDSKYAQMTAQQTLIGINKNAIFRIDPRLNGNKRVISESKQYVTKNEFNCAATTGKGELAVASSKGDIRLYNKLNIRAKTLLPGLGDPIIGVDTTENGKYIIATCKTYLLLIDTELKDSGGKQGFTTSMGEDKKPIPKRLQLRPEHVAALKMPISFTQAKFNTGQGDERNIVTSTGPFVITWNFRRVKQGKLYDYQIRQYDDTVVADNFKFGEDKNIIVALQKNVEMASKSALMTPAKMLKSRDSIVNSPY